MTGYIEFGQELIVRCLGYVCFVRTIRSKSHFLDMGNQSRGAGSSWVSRQGRPGQIGWAGSSSLVREISVYMILLACLVRLLVCFCHNLHYQNIYIIERYESYPDVPFMVVRYEDFGKHTRAMTPVQL